MNKSWWWLVIFMVVGVLLAAGVLYLVTRPPAGVPIQLLPPPTQAPLTVYVTGEVGQPGLYTLPFSSRLNDAIQAAGGFNPAADTNLLNLARVLTDGERIDVPALQPTTAPGSRSQPILPANSLVNINTGTLEQLDTLPGIGPVTAQAIIDYRNQNGNFTRVEDLMDVPGIGQATFDNIKQLVTTGMVP